jgi:hypothetical protein
VRRIVIVLLSLVEAAVGCGIFAESVALSHAVVRNDGLGRVAHAVVLSTRRIAVEVRLTVRRRLG